MPQAIPTQFSPPRSRPDPTARADSLSQGSPRTKPGRNLFRESLAAHKAPTAKEPPVNKVDSANAADSSQPAAGADSKPRAEDNAPPQDHQPHDPQDTTSASPTQVDADQAHNDSATDTPVASDRHPEGDAAAQSAPPPAEPPVTPQSTQLGSGQSETAAAQRGFSTIAQTVIAPALLTSATVAGNSASVKPAAAPPRGVITGESQLKAVSSAQSASTQQGMASDAQAIAANAVAGQHAEATATPSTPARGGSSPHGDAAAPVSQQSTLGNAITHADANGDAPQPIAGPNARSNDAAPSPASTDAGPNPSLKTAAASSSASATPASMAASSSTVTVAQSHGQVPTAAQRPDPASPAVAQADHVDASIKLFNLTNQPGSDATAVATASAPGSAVPSQTTHGPGQRMENLTQHLPVPDAQRDAEPSTAGQVVRGLTAMVNQRGGAMTMRLDPPEMGELRVQMTIVRGMVAAEFTTTTAQAQSLLEKNMTTLRTTLEAQGLTVDRLTVHVSSSSQQQATRDDTQQQSNSHQRSQQHDAAGGESRGRQQQDRTDGQSSRHDQRQRQSSEFSRIFDSTNDPELRSLLAGLTGRN